MRLTPAAGSRARLVARGLVLVGAIVGALAALLVVALVGRPAVRSHDELPAPLVAETTGAIAEVVLHYVPKLDAAVEAPYTDFLRAIASDVRVVFVVAQELSEEERSTLDRRVAAIDPSGALARQIRLVESPGPITIWSRDRALVTVAAQPAAPAWLLAPAEPDARWAARHNDWLTVRSLAAASAGRFVAKEAPFDYDAGDFAVDQGQVIVDTNLLEKNQHRGIRDVRELHDRLAAWLRMPVVVLGERVGDTPRHHLAMTMTPLGNKTALVGDPDAAQALVGAGFQPGELSSETAEPLVADFSAKTVARFERTARELERNGYRVERIPNVPFDDKTYISYTNGVLEARDGTRIVYMPVYDLPVLDAAARRVYERLGWQVRPVRVRSVYPHHGTIGCLVNVLGRRSNAR